MSLGENSLVAAYQGKGQLKSRPSGTRVVTVVLSDVRESMNRVKNCVFLVRKCSYTTFNIVNKRKMWEKKGKIRRTRSMTKKRSSEIFTLKMEIFFKLGRKKIFLVPPKFGARSPPMPICLR